MITLDYAIAFCQTAEKTLRPLGWHIGLTGSLLYGHPSRVANKDSASGDLDVIIYPHIEDDGTSKSNGWSPEATLKKIGAVGKIQHYDRGDGEGFYGSVSYIYVCKLSDGTKLDAFFLK